MKILLPFFVFLFCFLHNAGYAANIVDTDGRYDVRLPSSFNGAAKFSERFNGGSWGSQTEPWFSKWSRAGKTTGKYEYKAEQCLPGIVNPGGAFDDGNIGYNCNNSFTTLDTFYVILTPNTISTTSFNGSGRLSVSWSRVTGASGYQVQQSLNNGSWSTIYNGTATSTIRSNLGTGKYRYRVRAKLSSYYGSYQYSNYGVVLRSPSSLSVPTSTVTNGTIAMSWPAVSTSTRYLLQESRNNGSWVTLLNSTSRSYSRTGRSNGTYRYRVQACNNSGCSDWRYSSYVTVLLPPSVPASISVPVANDTDGAYTIRWSAASTATSYTLARRVNLGGWAYSTLSNLSKAYSGDGNASYQYAVRACNTSGCSAWRYSTSFTVLLPPSAPATISVPTSNDTDGAYTISWSASSTATSYTLARQVNSGSWAYTTLTSRSKAYSGDGNAKYRYAVRGCNTSGCGAWRYSSTFDVLLPPGIPSSISQPDSNFSSSYSVSWPAVSTATSYTLAQSVNGASWTYETISSLSKAFTERQDATYRYAVRACNSSGCGGYRYGNTFANTLAPSSISVPSTTIDDGVIPVNWTKSNTGSTYTLQESKNGSSWTTIANSQYSSFFREERFDGNYQYRVRACTSDGCSGWNTSAIAKVLLVTPSKTSSHSYSAEQSLGGKTISWAAAANATYYEIVIRYGDGREEVMKAPTSSFTLSLTFGDYDISIRSCNFAGMCSDSYKAGSYSPTVAVRYQHTDMLGSVVAETDGLGQVSSRSQYEPFGKRLDGDKAGIGYTGHLQDEDLNLTYMQARYYDPVIGRFYSNDPVDALGHMQRGNSISHGFNRYAYANNNPYKYVDPDGEFLANAIGAIVGAAIDAGIQYATTGEVDLGQVAMSAAAGAVGVGVVSKAATLLKAKKSFEIQSGVRRAKAAEIAGEKTIKAEIKVGEKVVKTTDVPIKSLRSPKTEISTEGAGLTRMNRAIKNQAEGKVEPITVTKGKTGTPIKDVTIE